VINFDLKAAEGSLQKKFISYDKSGDEHYDHISAFIKSMRGSDPDAALYWMSTMLVAGEDPLFIIRRVIICACEDVGNADPMALVVAASALQSIEFVGLPEAKIPLAQAVVYVATAPKSNASYMALHKSQDEVMKGKRREVPNHLKDSTLDGESRGHGVGYKYPHDFPGHFTEQEYMPDKKVFYVPSGEGYETEISKRLEVWRKKGKTAQADEAKKG
jgi:putative ATPase